MEERKELAGTSISGRKSGAEHMSEADIALTDEKNSPPPVACVVCGHINKRRSLICEMCSNYLFD